MNVFRICFTSVEDDKLQIGDTIEFMDSNGEIYTVVLVDKDDFLTKWTFLYPIGSYNFDKAQNLNEIITPDLFPEHLRQRLVKFKYGYFRLPYESELDSESDRNTLDERYWGILHCRTWEYFCNEYFADEFLLYSTNGECLVAADENDFYISYAKANYDIKPVFYMRTK